jgi:MoxR-like ATPase
MLIGNTFFKKDVGTLFCESQFVKAIRTPNSIILLDELSRGHHDFWNIILPVCDPTQRYLRLDETEDSSVVPVAEGVTFIATANVGNEYTATRVMDKALTSRFPVIVEMKVLDADQELGLLMTLYPQATKDQIEGFTILTKISYDTKKQSKMEEARITNFIPTGTVVEMAELVLDGFTLKEIVEMVIYPLYSEDGGAESERIYAKQIVQKYLDLGAANVVSPINDPAKKKRVNFA